jgi:hypothetical protein
MEIKGIEQQLSGYDFSSNESMTDYIIHSSKGAFPLGKEKETPKPDAQKMQEMKDTTQQQSANQQAPNKVHPSSRNMKLNSQI